MQVLDTVDLDAIRALHERGEFFWLDLDAPADADLDALGKILEIPGLAIEDSKEFGLCPASSATSRAIPSATSTTTSW
ncbi:MAG TPA: hypothetical protein VFY32_00060 [Solirubrobacteraceae bacterium]|nr:hypothetical protein [Solirubrobacteraceae bacterium]